MTNPVVGRPSLVVGQMKSEGRNKVVLAGLPPGFVDDLPGEDLQALLDAIGKPVVLNGYDQDGRAELQFKDKQGVVHFIYLDPKFVSFVTQQKAEVSHRFWPTTYGERPTTNLKGNH